MTVIPILSAKSCDGCTGCCDGWLHGVAHGIAFYPGRKCHFVSTGGCSIYENRPQDPCKSFNCYWITNKNVPGWMKPSLSNVVIAERKSTSGIPFFSMTEMGKKVDASVLNWVFQHFLGLNLNLAYQIEGGWNYLGSAEFIKEMTASK